MEITKGQKFYKKENYNVKEVEVIDVIRDRIKYKYSNSDIIFDYAKPHFLSVFSLSRSILYRDIYIDLLDKLKEVEELLMEADLKLILLKYRNK